MNCPGLNRTLGHKHGPNNDLMYGMAYNVQYRCGDAHEKGPK